MSKNNKSSENVKRLCALSCEIVIYKKAYSYDSARIADVIRNHDASIKHYCYVLHDRDENKDAHYHIFLQFKQTRYFDDVAKWFGVKIENLQKLKSRYKNAVLYCVHKHDKSKFQYSVSDVISNFDYQSLINDDNISNERIDFDAKGITYYKRLYQYDARRLRDVNTLYNNYLELRKKESVDRNMKVLYISGDSGIGKTTLAKAIAYQEYPKDEIFISSSSNDILDSYLGEKCIILDDFRDDSMSYSDLLKFLDNNTNSSVKSRYSNKQLVRCELVIITSIKEPNELYANITESKKQLYRRIGEFIKITKNNDDVFMVDYLYNEKLNRYELRQQANVTQMIRDYIRANEQTIKQSFVDSLISQGLATKV